MCVIPSANAATDIFGFVKIRISIAVNGEGINLKKIQIRFWTFSDNLLGKNNSKRGGVPIAIPDAKKDIISVVEISSIIGRLLNAFFNSEIEGKNKFVYFNGVRISTFKL